MGSEPVPDRDPAAVNALAEVLADSVAPHMWGVMNDEAKRQMRGRAGSALAALDAGRIPGYGPRPDVCPHPHDYHGPITVHDDDGAPHEVVVTLPHLPCCLTAPTEEPAP